MFGWQQLSEAEHHGGAYITSSGLKAALKSPAHYLLHANGGTTDNAAFAFGRAAHCRVLEPWEYAKRYVVEPQVDKRTKEGKAAYAEFLKQAEGREPISATDAALIESVSQSIANNVDASRWLNPEADDSFVEQSGVVMCERMGLLACRPDLRVTGDYIVDLKTCASADADYMSRSLVNFGYALSAAWYVDLARRIDGGEYRFIWVLVEKTAPYAVACYEADPQVLEFGRRQYQRALDVIEKAAKLDQWPAKYHDGTPFAELPRWAK